MTFQTDNGFDPTSCKSSSPPTSTLVVSIVVNHELMGPFFSEVVLQKVNVKAYNYREACLGDIANRHKNHTMTKAHMIKRRKGLVSTAGFRVQYKRLLRAINII